MKCRWRWRREAMQISRAGGRCCRARGPPRGWSSGPDPGSRCVRPGPRRGATQMIWALVAACLVATIPAGLRWLRVAQREHYLPGAVATFAGRWWTSGPAQQRPPRHDGGRAGRVVVERLVGISRPRRTDRAGGAADPRPDLATGLDIEAAPRRDRLGRAGGRLYSAGAVVESAFFVALGLFLLPALVDIALPRPRPDRAPYGQEVGGSSGRAAPGLGGEGGGDHRVLRQDDHQAVHRPSARRFVPHAGEPGVIQQSDGPGPGHQRAPRARHRGVCRRDGHVRARGDRGV